MHLSHLLQGVGLVAHEFKVDMGEVMEWPAPKYLTHLAWLEWANKMREEAVEVAKAKARR